MCLVTPGASGEIEQCQIIINRSLEVAEKTSKEESSDGDINVELVTPTELVAWLIGEELSHARFALKRKTFSAHAYAKEMYQKILAKKGIAFSGAYVNDIDELSASRNVVRFIAFLAKSQGDNERAEKLYALYRQSLERKMHLSPYIRNVMEKTYMKTGYS